MEFTETFIIKKEADFCLGHFPGNPVVPAAFLLSLVAQAVDKHLPGFRLQSINKVKFIAALRPEQDASIKLEMNNDSILKFSITRDNELIVSGKGAMSARKN